MNDVKITGEDRGVGMGIGGWHMRWTALHRPTGCSVTWETFGAHPQPQHRMRERALMALELLVEAYPPEAPLRRKKSSLTSRSSASTLTRILATRRSDEWSMKAS